MATKVNDRTSTIVAEAIGIAERKLDMQKQEGNLAQRIAGLFRAKRCLDRDDDAYKAIRKTLRDALNVALEGKPDELKHLASRTLDVQMSYGMNIVQGHNRDGVACDEKTGRPIKQKNAKRGTKAAKRDKPEAPQVKHVVSREGAVAFLEAALGAEAAFCISYILDNPSMTKKLVTMVKFDFESQGRTVKAA